MGCEGRGQAARCRRDVVLHHSGQEVHEEDNLVSGTGLRIEVPIVSRINQRSDHEAAVDDRFGGQRHDRMIG